MEPVRDSTKNLQLLSELLLKSPMRETRATGERVSALKAGDLQDLKALAMTNHVIMRSFAPLQNLLQAGGNQQAVEWIALAIQEETARIHHALGFLQLICNALEERGCPAIVIKSLDHWPDLGSDLDLYTDADAAKVVEVMSACFGAKLADRSWGDRLANKWNFVVPGLPELVEVHAGRLGQTGEQTAVTRSVSAHARVAEVGTSFSRTRA